MISSKDVKIKSTNDFTSKYIENELQNMGYDVLKWAITDFDGENYIVNIAYVENYE